MAGYTYINIANRLIHHHYARLCVNNRKMAREESFKRKLGQEAHTEQELELHIGDRCVINERSLAYVAITFRIYIL